MANGKTIELKARTKALEPMMEELTRYANGLIADAIEKEFDGRRKINLTALTHVINSLLSRINAGKIAAEMMNLETDEKEKSQQIAECYMQRAIDNIPAVSMDEAFDNFEMWRTVQEVDRLEGECLISMITEGEILEHYGLSGYIDLEIDNSKDKVETEIGPMSTSDFPLEKARREARLRTNAWAKINDLRALARMAESEQDPDRKEFLINRFNVLAYQYKRRLGRLHNCGIIDPHTGVKDTEFVNNLAEKLRGIRDNQND